LPGAGAPLDLDDDSLVPPEMRLAFRVLKNAGYIPEQVRLRREISDLEAVARDCGGDPAQRRAFNRLALLRTRLAARRVGEPAFELEAGYREKLLNALSVPAA
jgi:hypothetical protein